jgi:hypothetical protein
MSGGTQWGLKKGAGFQSVAEPFHFATESVVKKIIIDTFETCR